MTAHLRNCVCFKDNIDKHWLMVVKVFTEHERELSTMEKVVCFCDEASGFSVLFSLF